MGRRDLVFRDSPAIVPDLEAELVRRRPRGGSSTRPRARVPGHVRQRLLKNPEHGRREVRLDRTRPSGRTGDRRRCRCAIRSRARTTRSRPPVRARRGPRAGGPPRCAGRNRESCREARTSTSASPRPLSRAVSGEVASFFSSQATSICSAVRACPTSSCTSPRDARSLLFADGPQSLGQQAQLVVRTLQASPAREPAPSRP